MSAGLLARQGLPSASCLPSQMCSAQGPAAAGGLGWGLCLGSCDTGLYREACSPTLPAPPPPPRRPGRSGCGATSPSRIPGRGWSLCFRAFSACISSSSCWHWPPGWLPPSWLLGGEAGGLARPGYTHTATRVHIASSHRVTWIHTHSYTGTHTASHRVTWAHTSHTVTYTVTPIHSHMQSHTSHSADSLLTSVAPSQA